MTNDIYVGRFASRERLAELRDLKVTDVLNVSDTSSQLTTEDGPFRSVTWIDIEDRTLIPTEIAIEAIDTVHRSLIADDGRIYLHCMAGWNRSPTVLWLYLLACGYAANEAAQLICAEAFDAVPGHSLLVDSNLLATVVSHGRDNYLPHRRPTAIASP
ncbi:protein-tyrosine phosphatase family protein [Rubripirellula reticaptiva]|uniref:protein-tyrosine phosphatase family protein n=1 Tax=Rubripirellula reticaptiva TaxID=2528013 RepID=UPI00164472F6|nr:dual specificity protein phosphatase family protein [Rubripirellula reticaptiva]